jgi:hypothetical protein
MNLKKFHNDMAMFPLFVDVIHNQSKIIKTSSWHPQIKCGYNYNGINKSKKNMAFHGLVDHGCDYLVIELSSTRKSNSPTLTKYKPSQPHIPSHKFLVEFNGQ